MQRKEDEELLQFVLQVKENARYAEVDKLPVEDIISLIITSRCNIKQLTHTWALRRKLSLKAVLIDCEAYQRKELASKDFDQLIHKNKESGAETTQINAAMSGGVVKKQKANNRGKKGGHGTNNRGGGNNGQM